MLERGDRIDCAEIKEHHLCLHEVYRSVRVIDIWPVLNVLCQRSLSLKGRVSVVEGFISSRWPPSYKSSVMHGGLADLHETLWKLFQAF